MYYKLMIKLFSQLTQSDIVVIACSLSDETKGMFDKNAFLKMKPTSVLINIARGGIVNQEDLIEALKVITFMLEQFLHKSYHLIRH